MKSHRIIIYLGVLLAAVLALPGSALASSLLSGYGGPGQGNQAILGSALLNGPKGGGGSGGSSGSSTGAPSTIGGTSTTASSGTGSSSGGSSASGPSGKDSSGNGRGGARHAAGKSGPATTSTTSSAGRASFYPATERIPSGAHDGTLGLSGADFLYIVLGAVVLVSLGVLTRRVGGATQRGGHGS